MSQIKFKINGDQHTVGNDVTSTTSLLLYLRKNLDLRGTKYMCLSGRCGACLVSVRKKTGEPVQAVNSCLVLVTSCHKWEITTIENIGGSFEGYHSLQKEFAKKNATQCGYCTPGWIVALFSLLKNKSMTMLEIEQSLGSNICRCTGYRSILDASKPFGKDAPVPIIMDIEDLKLCSKTDKNYCNENCDEGDWCIIKANELSESSVISFELKDGKQWYRAVEISDILEILRTKGVNSYMLVHGNTARGLVPIDEFPQIMIDISGVSALKESILDQNLVIGGGMTITEMMDVFSTTSTKDGFTYLNEFNGLLKYFANIPVKNIGTVAGNMMLTHKNNSVISDLIIIFETVGATVTILNEGGVKKSLSMSDFMKEDMTGKLLLNVLLPPLSNEYKVVLYKIAGKAENAGSILCAGFLYKIDSSYRVLQCRISLGLTYLTRAPNTERFLLNKILFNNDTLEGAVNIMDNELIVTYKPPATSAGYRKRLAIGLFYKSLLFLCPPSILGSRYLSGRIDLRKTRPLSQGRQLYNTNPLLYPLNEPIPKVEALIQCGGEAPYSDDVISLPREVFAAYVLSTVARAKIENIDTTAALNIPGVLAFYSAKDIPGVNSFTSGELPISLSPEEVFCNGDVKYFNQPIGVIVAETQYLAEKAAKLVTVTYSNVRTPVTDIVQAKNDPTRTFLFLAIPATDAGLNIAKVINGNVTVRGQYHAFMETLTCVSHPTEEGLKIYTSSQHIDSIQLMTSRALKIPQNKIDVYIRRLGGGFGGKISRTTQVAVACSLVVTKLNRPCRLVLNLKTNMRAVGKRLPCHANFVITVDKNGEIQSMIYNLYEDNGCIINEPLIVFTFDCYPGCYRSKRWLFKVFNCITDTASNTWCRSPGSVECIAISEFMMEQISYEMGLDPLKVRLANLDTDKYDAIREMTEKLKTDCQYAERRAIVDNYNKENRWKKRGLRFAFMIWNPFPLPNYINVSMSVYSGDGTITITHGGIEMGQGLNTKAVQICAHILNVSIDKIQIKATNSHNASNNFIAGASVTSSNVGIGVERCSNDMLKILGPLKLISNDLTWPGLVKLAFVKGIDLQTHAFVNISDNIKYHVHGVACAEVELDVLTGESQILRVDLATDVGQSVSPGIDIGQVEGAFIMGLGYWLTERLVSDTDTGEVLIDSFNQYFLPQVLDIPQDFRTYFRPNSYSSDVILGSKATGEPATSLGVVVPIAIREAIVAARAESGIPSTEWFNIDGPYTVEKNYLACVTRLEDFKFY